MPKDEEGQARRTLEISKETENAPLRICNHKSDLRSKFVVQSLIPGRCEKKKISCEEMILSWY